MYTLINVLKNIFRRSETVLEESEISHVGGGWFRAKGQPTRQPRKRGRKISCQPIDGRREAWIWIQENSIWLRISILYEFNSILKLFLLFKSRFSVSQPDNVEPDSCCGQEEYNSGKFCCKVVGGVRKLGNILKDECPDLTSTGEVKESVEEEEVDERFVKYS